MYPFSYQSLRCPLAMLDNLLWTSWSQRFLLKKWGTWSVVLLYPWLAMMPPVIATRGRWLQPWKVCWCVVVVTFAVYFSPGKKVVLLQQRAPVIKGKQRFFVEELVEWYKACSFSSIILLSSVDKVTRTDDSLLVGLVPCLNSNNEFSSPLRYVSNTTMDISVINKKWIPYEGETPFKRGTTTSLLLSECEKQSIPLLVPILFVSEGDNRSDGVQLAHHVNEYLQLSENGRNLKQTYSLCSCLESTPVLGKII